HEISRHRHDPERRLTEQVIAAGEACKRSPAWHVTHSPASRPEGGSLCALAERYCTAKPPGLPYRPCQETDGQVEWPSSKCSASLAAPRRRAPARGSPKPFPAEVVAAWKEAGIKAGWMSRDPSGPLRVRFAEKPEKELPAFLVGQGRADA